MAGIPGMKTGGTNKKSTAHHRLAGTYRPDRHAGPKVIPLVSGVRSRAPRPPEGLSEASRALWTRTHREYDLRTAPSLELLISALRSLDVAEDARRTLETEGLTYKDASGAPKVHPAAAVHRDARAQFVTTMRVLGFPSEDK